MIRSLALSALMLISVGSLVAEDKAVAPAETPKVERLKAEQWCWTHDLPKDKCATCQPKLIPALKKAKDWCPEHAMAESVCVLCDPTAKALLDAQRPTEKPKDVK